MNQNHVAAISEIVEDFMTDEKVFSADDVLLALSNKDMTLAESLGVPMKKFAAVVRFYVNKLAQKYGYIFSKRNPNQVLAPAGINIYHPSYMEDFDYKFPAELSGALFPKDINKLPEVGDELTTFSGITVARIAKAEKLGEGLYKITPELIRAVEARTPSAPTSSDVWISTERLDEYEAKIKTLEDQLKELQDAADKANKPPTFTVGAGGNPEDGKGGVWVSSRDLMGSPQKVLCPDKDGRIRVPGCASSSYWGVYRTKQGLFLRPESSNATATKTKVGHTANR